MSMPMNSYATAQAFLHKALSTPQEERIGYVNEVCKFALETVGDDGVSDYVKLRKALHASVIRINAELHRVAVLFEDWQLNNPHTMRQIDLFTERRGPRMFFDTEEQA